MRVIAWKINELSKLKPCTPYASKDKLDNLKDKDRSRASYHMKLSNY
jgi:hypothetical protein